RLKWPVPMVRWRAAREIRYLLQSDATHAGMTTALLDFLERCATESEVCSALSLLFLTESKARPSRAEIVKRIKCPSILADILLEKTFGPGMGLGGWETAHSGEVPEEFEPDDYFVKHKAAHVPPTFYNELLKLERSTWLPFVRQWAWEWQHLREKLGTGFTLYPHYFDEYGELHAGVMGQYQQRQSEVFRSAHIRTFALAVATWNMPLTVAGDYLLDHIPAIGGFFDLDPGESPQCLFNLPTKCLAEGSDLQAVLADWVRANRSSESPCVSIASPFPMELEKYGEVYVGAYFVSPGFEMSEDHGLYEPMDFTLVKDTLSIHGVVQNTEAGQMKRKGKAGWSVPVCSSFLPIPHGFWTSDYFALGFPIVAPYCLPAHSAIRVREGFLELVAENETVARTRIWNDVWRPTYARGGNTRCGAAAELEKHLFDELTNRAPEGSKLAWFIRTRIWKRPTEYGEYAMEERRALALDEAINQPA
ncbi:hypothetical protein, partial [Mesorhizobium sp.]|uniref:hypothetical protein n=1 Tax=Mesorhizobium sp. TaxID=1871066 RepID=UPI0025E4EEBC